MELSLRKASVVLAYICGYIYTVFIWNNYLNSSAIAFLLFAAIFTGWQFILNKDQKGESWLWMAGMWMCVIVLCSKEYMEILPFTAGRVWSENGGIYLFVHGYAIYWILNRNGCLLKKESSEEFFWDCIHGVITIPFTHFFQLLHDTFYCLNTRQSKDDKKTGIYLLAASALAVIFFGSAVSLLSKANPQFATAFEAVIKLFTFNLSDDLLLMLIPRLILMFPVASYLYGLIVGSYEIEQLWLDGKKEELKMRRGQMKKIPSSFWNGVLIAFIVLYLVFFGFQGNYLFSAIISHRSAQGYTIAQYAREGFFELCKVMAINFALMLIMYRTDSQGNLSKKLCIGLMVESILLAVTAFSKILLYIMEFGFTPLRIQGIWLTTVLMAGCICVIYYLLTEKNSARYWILFTAATLMATMIF